MLAMRAMLDRSALRKILLLRLSAIGDVVNTLPSVTALRAALPAAHLAFAVEDKAADLVVGHPDLDETIVLPRRRWRELPLPAALGELRAYVRGLRERRFDAVVDFQANLKGGLHAWLSGAKVRIGFARGHGKELDHLFANVHVAPPGTRIPRARKFLSLLEPFGVVDAPLRARLPDSPASEDRVGRWLEDSGLAPGGYALLHPGTSAVGARKRWPVERFALLADRLERELGLRAVAAWGPGERELAEAVAASSRARVSMETRSLLDLAALARRARLFIGADSGPLHLACAVGAPAVALFGPKDPAVYAPALGRARVVHAPGPDGAGEMLAIGVEDALLAARELLGEHDRLAERERIGARERLGERGRLGGGPSLREMEHEA